MGYSDEPTSDEGTRMRPRLATENDAIAEAARMQHTIGRDITTPVVTNGGIAKRYPTLVATFIFNELLPEWEELFLARNANYGEYDAELQELGEMVEIFRKYKKLKRAFIDKVDTSNWDESPREVALDMIGHLFLLIAVIDDNGGLLLNGKTKD